MLAGGCLRGRTCLEMQDDDDDDDDDDDEGGKGEDGEKEMWCAVRFVGKGRKGKKYVSG